jgi:hypothetical protein
MENNQANSRATPARGIAAGNTAAQKAESTSHFKRELVPLDEYAARQGISSDIVEQQGQLGVIQVRKFKGQKFVVDVPIDQLSDFETADIEEHAGIPARTRPTTGSKWLTVGLTAGLIILIVSVFWLYIDTKQKLDDLSAEHTILQNRYNGLAISNQEVKTAQDELTGSKAELALIQNRIASSRAKLDAIQADLNKARQNLDTVQSELTGIGGQISLSKVEIESVQNALNDSKNNLDGLHRQNVEPGTP